MLYCLSQPAMCVACVFSQVCAERLKAGHAAAEAALREAATAEQSELKAKLAEALREAAVGRAMIDGWQRDNKVKHAPWLEER